MSLSTAKQEDSPLLKQYHPLDTYNTLTPIINDDHNVNGINNLVRHHQLKRSLANGFSSWRNDLMAGFNVSLINIPLSVSLGVASLATPSQGIITAIWSGLIASIFGGSAFNIVGPTGALTGILSKYATELGSDILPWLAITSASVIFIAYLLRWDRYSIYIPCTVTEGFTLGVACIIAIGQLPAALGLIKMQKHSNAVSTLWELLTRYNEYNYISIILCFTLWFSLYWLIKWVPRIPWSVLIVSIGIVIGYLDTHKYIDLGLITLKDKYGMLESAVIAPNLTTNIPLHHWWTIIVGSLSIAFVAVLETIISGRIADSMTRTTMNQRQEVIGLALANIVSGLAGGIPATAALARTSLNIRSGAQSKLSGIASAISTGMFAYLIMPLFSYMPLLVVSALLFQVSVGMVDTRHLADLIRYDRNALIRTLLVAVIACAVDPTSGIVVGAIMGLLDSADSLASGFCEIMVTNDFLQYRTVDAHHTNELLVKSIQSSVSAEPKSNPSGVGWLAAIYRPIGSLSYLSAISHVSRIRSLYPSKYLILSMRFLNHIDMDGVAAIQDVITDLQNRGITVVITTLTPQTYERFSLLPWFQQMIKDNNVYTSLHDATTEFKKDSNI